MKTFAGFWVTVAFLSACATKTPPADAARQNKKIENILSDNDGDPVGAPAEVGAENVPDETPATSADARPATFAVWIDAYGYDAYAALAFLQELEKAGHKPEKIVGTGYGCWVAQSWAVANSGNRAEWQASKWNDWANIRGGLINRLTGGNQTAFEENALKLLNIREWSQFKLPVDCPLLRSQTPYALGSAHDRHPETAFWTSMQLGMFGVAERQLARSGAYTGVLGGAPTESELADLSRELRTDGSKRFAGWLVLSTRPRIKSGAAGEVATTLLPGRSGQWVASVDLRVAGEARPQVKAIGLAPAGEFSGEDLTKPENRRRFLLQGRKTAQALLPTPEFKDFFLPVH